MIGLFEPIVKKIRVLRALERASAPGPRKFAMT
jgi:hypothetical protein